MELTLSNVARLHLTSLMKEPEAPPRKTTEILRTALL